MAKNNYKRLGDYIKKVNVRNTDNLDIPLMGLSIQKCFIPSIANTIGTNMTRYKIIERDQFAYGPVTSRNGDKITIALFDDYDKALISQAYIPFKIKDKEKLLPKYLMMWFSRPEFDRYARFKSHGSARETFDWDEMCDVELSIPSIEKQRQIVADYQAVENKIKTNEAICEKLEETAQTIYRRWFEEFEFPFDFAQGKPDEEGKPYKSSGGKMVWNEELEKEVPEGWEIGDIGDYARVKSGFAFKSSWWKSSGIPVIKIGSINNNTIEYTSVDYVAEERFEEVKNYLAKEGDLVIAMTGATIGKIGIVPKFNSKILINQRVGLFDLKDQPLNKIPFLYFTLLQESILYEIRNIGGDSAQANISNSQIENIKFIMPNDSIIEDFNSLTQPIVKSKLMITNQLQKFRQLQSLLLGRMTRVEP